MIYKTNESLGDIKFVDTIEDVKSKLENNVELGERVLMGKRQQTILYEGILIVFKSDGNSIDYVEVKNQEIIFNNINLFESRYSDLEKLFLSLDSDLNTKEDGFDSYKCGLGVYRGLKSGDYTVYPEQIILFNEDYENSDQPDADDIIKFYLGK